AAADVPAAPDPGVSTDGAAAAAGDGLGTSRSQPGSMRLGSVKVSPLSSVCPWLAPQMAVHSWGLPYSRPEMVQRESPGWTWTSWSPGGEEELERSDAPGPGVVGAGDAGWYTAVTAVLGASP